jgi:alanyl-tRNA synthetase
VIVLASAQNGKASLVAAVQGAAQAKVKASDVLSHIAGQIGGKGGGRADFAQGGGDDGPALTKALAELNAWLAGKLG